MREREGERKKEAVRGGKQLTPRNDTATKRLLATTRNYSRGRGYFSAGHVHGRRHFCYARGRLVNHRRGGASMDPDESRNGREAKESLRVTHGCRGRRAGASAGVTGSGSVRDSRHLGAWGRGARKTTRKTTDSLSYLG